MVKKNDFRHRAHFFLLLVHRCTVEPDPNISQSNAQKVLSFCLYFLRMKPSAHAQPINFNLWWNHRFESLFLARGTFYNYKTLTDHKLIIKGVNRSCLQLEAFCQKFYRWMFYDGGLWVKCLFGSQQQVCTLEQTQATQPGQTHNHFPDYKPDQNGGSFGNFLCFDFAGKKYACSCWICLHFNLIMASSEL